MKLLKVLFSIVLLLLVVVGLAITALMYTMDPNKLKPVLADVVMQRTGYQMIIQGDLLWSIYPRIGIKAERILLHTPNQHAAFIELQDVRVGSDLLQLIQGKEHLQGDVYIQDVTLTNLHAQNAQANLNYENGVLSIKNIIASVYGGGLNGEVHLTQLSSTTELEWNLNFSNVQLQPLLADAGGPDGKLKVSGIANINMQGSTQGNTREETYNNLNGGIQFAVGHGVAQGINLNYYIDLANAILNKSPAPVANNLDQTEFNSLIGTAKIVRGQAQTNDIVLTAPSLVAKLQGNVNLLTQALDLQMQIKPLISTTIPLDIPVAIKGDIHTPDISLDTVEIQKFLAKQDIDKFKTQALEKIKEKAPEVGQVIQQLIN